MALKWRTIRHCPFELVIACLSLMGSSVITPEDVLKSLMNDGTIDAIRLKIINQLKGNEELKNNTITMVEQSKVLNTPGAEKQTKRELFDALRQELETPVLEKASKAVWELILDNNGLGKEISETVERVYCRLSGREPPPPLAPAPAPALALVPAPDSAGDVELENEKEKKEKEEVEKVNEVEMSESSSSRKRTFGVMNAQGAEAAADGPDQPPVVSDDGAAPSSNPRT